MTGIGALLWSNPHIMTATTPACQIYSEKNAFTFSQTRKAWILFGPSFYVFSEGSTCRKGLPASP